MKRSDLELAIKEVRDKVKELEKLEKGGQLPNMSYCMRSKRALKNYRERLEFLTEQYETAEEEE